MSAPDPVKTDAPTAFVGTVQPLEEVPEPEKKKPRGGKGSSNAGAAETPETEIFRPRQRPPFPLLMVLDDNQRSAQSIRIRKSPFGIGRAQGDFTAPLDGRLSATHAELFVQEARGRHVWSLRDLHSTNGTYVRVSNVLLKPGQMLLIGAGRFRFEAGSAPEPDAGQLHPNRTQPWSPGPAKSAAPPVSLVQLDHGAGEQRFHLSGDEHWIGRDPQRCSLVLDDPMVSPQHARLFRDDQGRWHAENHHSLNGLWTNIDQLALPHGGYFQCGEQRFLLKI